MVSLSYVSIFKQQKSVDFDYMKSLLVQFQNKRFKEILSEIIKRDFNSIVKSFDQSSKNKNGIINGHKSNKTQFD